MAERPAYVCYLRVSTTQQGHSGLGLEAQRAAVHQFVAARQGRIIAPEFVEIESGKNSKRPELANAIARCRKTGATLLVSKLDRLSRNVSFLMTLRDSGIELAAADMPEANTLIVTVMAGLAQHEAEMISQRTKAALAAAKARGVKLGGYRPRGGRVGDYQELGVIANAQRAKDDAEQLREDVEPLVREGLSLRGIAAYLNANEIRTPRKKVWSPQSIKNLVNRLNIARN